MRVIGQRSALKLPSSQGDVVSSRDVRTED